ncbi:hypothetical protein SKA58_00375 [Sphingomonas sp. SKA58]|nr:hypothetical protein SKA58_00375 [Sphingomonas sp. SKA58]
MDFTLRGLTIGSDLPVGFLGSRYDDCAGVGNRRTFAFNPLIKAITGDALGLLVDTQRMRRKDEGYSETSLNDGSHLRCVRKMCMNDVGAPLTIGKILYQSFCKGRQFGCKLFLFEIIFSVSTDPDYVKIFINIFGLHIMNRIEPTIIESARDNDDVGYIISTNLMRRSL